MLTSAKMPKMDHRVCQAVRDIVQFSDSLKSQQQALELIFPGKDALNGVESLLETLLEN